MLAEGEGDRTTFLTPKARNRERGAAQAVSFGRRLLFAALAPGWDGMGMMLRWAGGRRVQGGWQRLGVPESASRSLPWESESAWRRPWHHQVLSDAMPSSPERSQMASLRGLARGCGSRDMHQW